MAIIWRYPWISPDIFLMAFTVRLYRLNVSDSIVVEHNVPHCVIGVGVTQKLLAMLELQTIHNWLRVIHAA